MLGVPTPLELGHCLRTPAEGPCECDLYLRCSKFFTTSDNAVSDRIRGLLDDLAENTEPDEPPLTRDSRRKMSR